MSEPNKLKILFITRKHPPQVGGMERLSYRITNGVKQDKSIIALRQSNIHLIWFFPYALVRALLTAKSYSVIHLGDPLLSLIGYLVKKIYKKPISVTIHGLDVTYKNKFYQLYLKLFGKKFDQYICISRATQEAAQKNGYPNTIVVPVGIETPSAQHFTRDELAHKLNVDLSGKTVLLTVGRLVKRKGVAWFIQNVLPGISDNILYVVVGEGEEENNIKHQIRKTKQDNKVLMTGRVDDELINLIYSNADIFIMPNIKVPGDMEGFGIVALEAAAHGLVVVASEIEGIKDAIINGYNGILVPAEDVKSYTDIIINYSKNAPDRANFGQKAQQYTLEHYGWPAICEEYRLALLSLIKEY